MAMSLQMASMRRFLRLLLPLIALQITACSTESNSVVAIPNVLSWTAPSQREDSSPLQLSEIAGYKIYYGTTQGVYPNAIDITDGSAVQAEMPTLSAGTYYVVVTTIDTNGRESLYSQEVTLVI
jgi:hypothetical protein